MKFWSVYLLRCSDGKIYTGCTSDLSERIKRHKLGQVGYTSSRLPVDLIMAIQFRDKYLAYKFEKYLKSGSGKAFAKRHFETYSL